MTKDRDFKRRVRERMAKTGESYTAARAHLLGARPAAADAASPATPAPPPIPSDYLDLAGMSDEAVAEATGRDWPTWTRWLDERDAASLPHREIARLLADHTPNGWWAQSVTGAYERIRKLRDHGQRRDGRYESSRSRTLPIGATELFRWISDPELRARWLPDPFDEGAVNPPRSVRLRWPDGTRVQLYIEAKGDAKARIAAQHTGLTDADHRDRQRRYWADRLDALKAMVG